MVVGVDVLFLDRNVLDGKWEMVGELEMAIVEGDVEGLF